VLNGELDPTPYRITAFTTPVAYGGVASISYYYDTAAGQLVLPLMVPVSLATGVLDIFIHKVEGDKTRWATDLKNMLMAATTFEYEFIGDTGRLRNQPALKADDVHYDAMYWQTCDEHLLGEQVDSFTKSLKAQSIFNDLGHPAHTSSHAYVREQIDDATFQALPPKAEIIRPFNGLPFADMGAEQLIDEDNDIPNLLTRYGVGTHPVAIASYRFPHPYWTIVAHEPTPTVTEFVERYHDKPNLMLSAGDDEKSADNLAIIGVSVGGVSKECAPIICGVVESVTQRPSYLIYALAGVPNLGPHSNGIDAGSQFLPLMATTAKISRGALAYGHTTQAFNIARKELSTTTVLDDEPHRLFGFDGDYIASTYSSHIDLMFPWRQLIITSDDLQQLPEKSQDAASRQPILSSYTLSTLGNTSVDKDGKAAGGISHPFGTVYFSESGTRRYHHLLKLPGALRSFRLSAALTYKDNSKEPVKVRLMPGGQFVAQLLFTRKMEET